MVLPHTPSQRGEVQVCVTRGRNARDVDTNVVIVNLCDDCVAEAMSCHTQYAHQAVKAPNGYCGIDPAFVAPLVSEAKDDVIVAADHGQDGEHDMPGEKQFVGFVANVEDGGGYEEGHGQGGDDTPDPVRELAFLGVSVGFQLKAEVKNRVEDGLDGGDARDPAVEQEECRMAPVGDPE